MARKIAAAVVTFVVWRAWPAVRTLIDAVREGTGSKYRPRPRDD